MESLEKLRNKTSVQYYSDPLRQNSLKSLHFPTEIITINLKLLRNQLSEFGFKTVQIHGNTLNYWQINHPPTFPTDSRSTECDTLAPAALIHTRTRGVKRATTEPTNISQGSQSVSQQTQSTRTFRVACPIKRKHCDYPYSN